MQADLFSTETQPPPNRKLIFSLDLGGRLPSWNDILGMEQWARYQFKNQVAADFLCALRASAADSSTKITCARSSMSIFADTLESYLKTRQEQRKLRAAKRRLEAKSASLFESKSSAKVPF